MTHLVELHKPFCLRTEVAEMNTWLTHELGVMQHRDWSWGYDLKHHYYLYSFEDGQVAMAFALRWK